MRSFRNLSGTNKLLILLGLIGVPLSSYVLYEDFVSNSDGADDGAVQEFTSSSEPSLLLPMHDQKEAATEEPLSKTEVYEDRLEKKERAIRESRQVENPFKEIMDEDFFSAESGKESPTDEEDLEARYQQWLAENETKEANRKTLTTKETRQRIRATLQESRSDPPEDENGNKELEQQFTFYSKTSSPGNEEDEMDDTETIRALVHNEQVVTNNSPLRVRILEDAIVGGIEIPKNSIIWGNVSFGRDRVRISFSSVDIGGRIIPFSKDAYGKDGMEGIPLSEIPGAGDLIDNTREDRLSDLERRRGVVGEIAGSLDALSDSKTSITFRDSHPFYLR